MDAPEFAEHAVGALNDHDTRLTRLEEREATREVQEAVDVLSDHEERLGKIEAQLRSGVWRLTGIGVAIGILVGLYIARTGPNHAEVDVQYFKDVAMIARNVCRALAERHDEPLSVCDG